MARLSRPDVLYTLGSDAFQTHAQGADQRIDLVSRDQKVAGDRGLAAPGGLEVDGVGAAQRSGDLQPHFDDRVAPRHAELVDAAIRGAFDADDLIEFCGIEIDRGRRRWIGRRRIERCLALAQGRANHGRHLCGIAMAADMHVEGGGRGAQDMIVDGGDLEAAVQQLGHDGRDLGFEKHEVAHQHGFTAHRGERDPAAQCQRRFDGHAVERHLQIGPRQAVAVYIA